MTDVLPHSCYPDKMIERAAELWCRLLQTPKFDNGDNGPTGFFAHGMASMLAEKEWARVDDVPGTVEAFRQSLVTKLKFLRDHEGEKTGHKLYEGHPGERDEIYYFNTSLNCDYHPCYLLAEAAQETGLPQSAFSWKTNVNIFKEYISVKVGYGAEYRNHYPLPDGRWLITDIQPRSTGDFLKVLGAVLDGRLDLEIESARDKN